MKPERNFTSLLAARVIEVAWLIAVAIIPLLHDPHGALGFDPIKIAVLRALGVVVGIMLVVRGAVWVSGGGRIRRLPFWVAALLLLWCSAAISSVISIDPHRSFWGSPQLEQGFWTLSCAFVLFAGVATHLRTGAQRRRLADVTLAGSVGVVLYSLVQHTAPAGTGEEGASFAGHPLYLAGYLLMVMPVCVWRTWVARNEERSRTAVLYGALLAMQLAAFLATEKRGPLLALILAAGGGVILLAAVSGRQRLARLAIWGSAGALAGLVALAGMREAGVPLDDVPLASRLSRTIPLGNQTGDAFRDSIWRAAPSLVVAKEPILLSDGYPDPARAIRPWLGYGPETLQRILIQRWEPPVIVPLAPAEGRFHSGFWDAWQSVGVLGLLAYLAVFATVFQAACRSAGIAQAGSLGVASSVIAASAAGLAAGGMMSVAYGVGYFGLGSMVGLSGGAVALAAWSAMRRTSVPVAVDTDSAWAIAVLVALIGHWIDMAFVFETASALTLALIFGGAVVGMERKCESSNESENIPWMPAHGVGLIVGLMLAVVLNGLIHGLSVQILNPFQILWSSLAGASNGLQHGFLLAIPFVSGAACIGILGTTMGLRTRREFLIAGGIAVVLALGFAWMKSVWLAGTGPIPGGEDIEEALRQSRRLESIAPTLLAGCLGIVFLATVMAGPVRIVPALIVVCAMLLAWTSNATSLRFQAASGWGEVLLAAGRFEASAAVYGRSLEIDPSNDVARVLQAVALMEVEGGDEDGTVARMNRAVETLEAGRRIGWVTQGDFQLGRAHLRGALAEQGAEERSRLAHRAKEAFARAVRFDPFSAPTWFEASLVDRLLFDDGSAASAKLAKANTLTSPPPGLAFDAAQWGRHYEMLANRSVDAQLRSAFGRRALEYFERSLDAPPEEGFVLKELRMEEEYRTLLAMGNIRRDLGERQAAVDDYLRATRIESSQGTWEARGRLAETLAAMGESEAALRYVDQALEDAPPEVREGLESIRTFLLTRP